jgi:PAS domain S-box-containing protein
MDLNRHIAVAHSTSADDRSGAPRDPGGTPALDAIPYERDLATGRVVGSAGLAALVGPATDVAAWLARVHPDDVPLLRAAREAALAGTAADYRVEYRVRRADGRWTEVLDHALIVRDEAQRAVREVGAVVDRAAAGGRVASSGAPGEADAALHASAERLRLATRAAGLCLWDYRIIDDELDWSEECRGLFGLAPDAPVTHAGFLAAVHPADRDRVARAIERTFHEYAEYDIEFRIVRPGGEVRWVAAVGDCLYDALGRAERFLGVMIDVTGRKRAEVALRESEERFRQLAEAIDGVFWIYDTRAGLQMYVSPGYARLFGQDPQELYGDPDAWLRNVHPHDRTRMERAYAPEPPQREFAYEYRIELPAGVRWARDRGVVVRDAAGRPVRIVGITEDITERGRASTAGS